MTVAELIEKLKEFPPDAKVHQFVAHEGVFVPMEGPPTLVDGTVYI